MNPYQHGDPRPEGYLARIAWAKAQKSRQVRCACCARWYFHHELPHAPQDATGAPNTPKGTTDTPNHPERSVDANESL